jgi:3-deoxy-manno-octulosonate cytidylyltransferase (CMP-KDO synthetase)
VVVIPARWGSTRLPGKPLRPIAGRTLLHRSIAAARAGAGGAHVLVATDDRRIAAHAAEVGCEAVLTDPAITSGSARALVAAGDAARIVNFQGDSPFLPPRALPAVLEALARGAEVATPVVQLGWADLDALRRHKGAAPFSGTTCARAADGRALWFSKAILPALRDEPRLRAAPLSPVWRHVGLYGYARAALERFEATPPTAPERLEGLEQLRLLELGIPVEAVAVSPARFDMSGIDTEADIARAEALIAAHGDPQA